ncbi:MAG: metal ABC transporter substrate-binding protein [Anaerolineales bacterium]
MPRWNGLFWGLALAAALLLAGCGAPSASGHFEDRLTSIEELSPAALSNGRLLRVVATTNIVGDVAAQIGDGLVELSTILPLGADPHGYQMTASDLQLLEQADIVFLNGLGLEESMSTSLDQFINQVPMVSVSEGIEVLAFGQQQSDPEHAVDPHVWMDPTRVMIWADNIAQALGALDPEHAGQFQTNADRYLGQLQELDGWVQTQIDSLPSDRRVLVTDHENLGYFADRYGMQIVGAIVPAYSAVAEPSARQLAELQDTIQSLGVPAVFVGTTVNPSLAEQVANDLGIQVVPIYTGSLSEAGGPASSYLQFMRYDVDLIVEALRP